MLASISLVGMTGFEPATTRPPDEYATGLRHIPILESGVYWIRTNDPRPVKAVL